ncbi:hypothetical protein SA58113_1871 [Staphylococcus argenteus]|nr:hypothetical protein SA58113_1871 [Staphylococcus argenteus]
MYKDNFIFTTSFLRENIKNDNQNIVDITLLGQCL